MSEGQEGRAASSGDRLAAGSASEPGARPPSDPAEAARAEVRDGLSRPQKELSPKYFYDHRGSELFDEITRLPEYYLTRAERGLLARWMPEWLGRLRPRSLVELGAGSGEKTRLVLNAMQLAEPGAVYMPMDVSRDFLEHAAEGLREDYPGLEVRPMVGDIASGPLPAHLPGPVLFVFLGSTLGNFSREASIRLLGRICAAMALADRLLLGADLRKAPAIIERAYNDARGVTAEFNLNILFALNELLGADFAPAQFAHQAFYDRRKHCIEMHLVARSPQTVRIPGAGEFRIEAGETIRTEVSCKYDRATLEDLYALGGLRLERWEEDRENGYALTLAAPASDR